MASQWYSGASAHDEYDLATHVQQTVQDPLATTGGPSKERNHEPRSIPAPPLQVKGQRCIYTKGHRSYVRTRKAIRHANQKNAILDILIRRQDVSNRFVPIEHNGRIDRPHCTMAATHDRENSGVAATSVQTESNLEPFYSRMQSTRSSNTPTKQRPFLTKGPGNPGNAQGSDVNARREEGNF